MQSDGVFSSNLCFKKFSSNPMFSPVSDRERFREFIFKQLSNKLIWHHSHIF
jgi:hypothetical protein